MNLSSTGLRVILALFAFGTLRVHAEPIDFTGHQVVAIRLTTQQQVDTLLALESASADFDVWSEGVGLGVVQVRVSPAQRAVLDASGLAYHVVIEDVQAGVVAERGGGPGFFDSFQTLAQHVAFLNGLVAQYPQLASMVNLGNSIEGRPIWAIRITGTGTNKPGVLIHGCEHAREWLTPPTVAYVAEHLLTNYDSDPNVQLLVESVEWYLLPVMNPDGYEYTWTNNRYWRKNRRSFYGVDLNRNWGHFWGGAGSSGSINSETYRGASPFSEPETQALRDFLLANPHVRGHVDLHTFGTLLMWPWAYSNSFPPDQSTFLSVATAMRNLAAAVHGLQYILGPVYSTIYPAAGASVDWVYGVAGRWSLTFELRGNDFAVPPGQIRLAAEENLPALLYFGAWLAACDPNGAAMGLTVGGASFPDCNANSVADICELAAGGFADCNGNLVPDECDVADGTSNDCNVNMVPDECEADCNENGLLDGCEIADGIAADCNVNNIPDECDVDSLCGPPIGACPGPGSCLEPAGQNTPGCACSACCYAVCQLDPYCCSVEWDFICALIAADHPACENADSVGTSNDCNENGIPDECEPDCNGNGVADECDLAAGISSDCDANMVPDDCEPDFDFDGVIDPCDNCPVIVNPAQQDGDFDGQGDVCDPCPQDAQNDSDGDGACDSVDECPNDPNKQNPGQCGCAMDDADFDNDGTADCVDQCPGVDDALFAPGCAAQIPATNQWGVLILALVLITLAKLCGRRALRT